MHPGEPGGRDGEDVRVEPVGVHDVDVALAQIAGEPELLAHGPAAVEAFDLVLRQWTPRAFDVGEELAHHPETSEVRLEPGAVEPLSEIEGLALGAAHRERGQELEHPHDVRAVRVRSSMERRSGAHDAHAIGWPAPAAVSRRWMEPAATASPAR